MIAHDDASPRAGSPRAWYAWVLAAAALLGAFLAFQVQPLICKAILPWFGGSPAVWNTCVLFFQALLFGGYLYAHLTTRHLGPRAQAAVHLALIGAALAALPILPGSGWMPEGDQNPTLGILALLAASVGLPYFLLSTTGPLVQAWFSRAYPAGSPYRLYALSNVGSLAGLLGYPFVFEPRFDVAGQSRLWAGAFATFALISGVAAARIGFGRTSGGRIAPGGAPAADPGSGRPGIGRRLLWLGLPATASLMLLATTNHACQDVAAIPFLWVVPLGLYLLSFIICFDHERWYARRLFGAAAMLSILAVAGVDVIEDAARASGIAFGFAHELAVYFAALFFVCMVCHGELVRLRPGPGHLTEFYLMIAGGGVLGGAFVSLVAPRAFSTYLEWEIGLALGYAVAAMALARGLLARHDRRRTPAAACIALAALGVPCLVSLSGEEDPPLDIVRNFYGVISIYEVRPEDPSQTRRVMYHGHTSHGKQFLLPSRRREATTYYGPDSGVGVALAHAMAGGRPVRVGAVGLGVGTLAAYARPGDSIRFYEINPEVPRMARAYFTYLEDCEGTAEIALGDARLTLEREPGRGFDVLALDAFSGDAIPTHLLTAEAFGAYLRHLAPGGILAVHITNNYLDLAPVVRRLAEHHGLGHTRVIQENHPDRQLYYSDWMLLTRDDDFLATHPAMNETRSAPVADAPLWTDGYSNLFQVLLRD